MIIAAMNAVKGMVSIHVKKIVRIIDHRAHARNSPRYNVGQKEHGDWYRELFQPSVAVGLLKPTDLAGYRRSPVFIRQSKHIPPRWQIVSELMEEFFQLITQEKEPSVRVVLGHFFFVYIHPYSDGNGRIGRFLMNVMLASGYYTWTIIPVERRNEYMEALEQASVNQNIVPFTKFIASCI